MSWQDATPAWQQEQLSHLNWEAGLKGGLAIGDAINKKQMQDVQMQGMAIQQAEASYSLQQKKEEQSTWMQEDMPAWNKYQQERAKNTDRPWEVPLPPMKTPRGQALSFQQERADGQSALFRSQHDAQNNAAKAEKQMTDDDARLMDQATKSGLTADDFAVMEANKVGGHYNSLAHGYVGQRIDEKRKESEKAKLDAAEKARQQQHDFRTEEKSTTGQGIQPEQREIAPGIIARRTGPNTWHYSGNTGGEMSIPQQLSVMRTHLSLVNAKIKDTLYGSKERAALSKERDDIAGQLESLGKRSKPTDASSSEKTTPSGLKWSIVP